MKKSLLVIVLIFAFVIFAGLSLPSCSKKETAPEPTETTSLVTLPSEPLATVDATSIDSAITAIYDGAETKAKAWKPDAKLYLVSVKLPSDLSLNTSTQTYTYGSSGVPDDWWTYSYAESTGKYVRALIPKEDYLGDVTKLIDKNYWRTNYVEAFQIAEINGGSAFRQANDNVTIILTLSQGEPKGWLWWLVEYKAINGNNLKIRINPSNKTVVDETGTVITSEITSPTTTATTTAGTTMPTPTFSVTTTTPSPGF